MCRLTKSNYKLNFSCDGFIVANNVGKGVWKVVNKKSIKVRKYYYDKVFSVEISMFFKRLTSPTFSHFLRFDNICFLQNKLVLLKILFMRHLTWNSFYNFCHFLIKNLSQMPTFFWRKRASIIKVFNIERSKKKVFSSNTNYSFNFFTAVYISRSVTYFMIHRPTIFIFYSNSQQERYAGCQWGQVQLVENFSE